MERLREHLDLQAGVVGRRQAFACGLGDSDLRRLIRRRDLVIVHPGVYVDHTGPLTWSQAAWAAVLACWPAALAGESALRDPDRRDGPVDGPITVVVAHERRIRAPRGVRVVRRIGFPDRVRWNGSPPALRYEEAVVDVAASAPTDLAAVAVLSDSCRSRRTTAQRLRAAVQARSRLPRRAWLLSVLDDIDHGTASVLEHGYLVRVERPHGLPEARRQVRARGTMGTTYRDVEHDGLVIELDGRQFHESARQRDRDLDRDLDVATEGGATVRIGYGRVFDRPCRTAARLAVLLQRRGWAGCPRRCGTACQL